MRTGCTLRDRAQVSRAVRTPENLSCVTRCRATTPSTTVANPAVVMVWGFGSVSGGQCTVTLCEEGQRAWRPYGDPPVRGDVSDELGAARVGVHLRRV